MITEIFTNTFTTIPIQPLSDQKKVITPITVDENNAGKKPHIKIKGIIKTNDISRVKNEPRKDIFI